MKQPRRTGLTVLVAGAGGGREHALAWKVSQSPQVARVCVAPGNPAMPPEWERWEWPQKSDFSRLATRALAEKVDLVIVGPDQALADGLVDVLEAAGLLCFGPRQAAARLEASKAFAKEVMTAAGVPTARYFEVRTVEEARKVLRSVPWPAPGDAKGGWVVKADGLALGKGVVVCSTCDEALAAAGALMAVSGSLVIEERLSGEEISWLALCDGERCALLDPARDYKRVFDGDQGPNTGGMGAVSPVPGVPASWWDRVRDQVFLPVLAEMRRRGTPFRGVLYAGLMADFARDRFSVLEFNARFGDPEAQVLLPRMHGDWLEWALAVARGDLSKMPERVPFSRESGVYVVAAARGYPEAPEKGRAIRRPSAAADLGVPPYFFAGVSAGADGGLASSGGRVLGALGMGASLEEARARAYQGIEAVSFEGMHFRRDIGGPPREVDSEKTAKAPVPIVVFASGRGSGFESIAQAVTQGTLDAEIRAVVTDQPDAGVIARARRRGIPVIVVPAEGAESPGTLAERRARHEEKILGELKAYSPRFLVMAGYMRVVTERLIEAFRSERGYSRIVNVHPSLLPAFPGVEAYRQAFEHGARVSGVSVHLVEREVDSGPICAQESFSIEGLASPEEVEALGLAIEHRLYPQTLTWVLSEDFAVIRQKERLRVRPN